MAPLSAGLFLLVLALSFTYYTLWTLLTPLLPESSGLQDFFPSRTWAVSVPVGMLMLGLALILGWIGWQALLESRRLDEQARQAGAAKKET